MLNKLPTVLAVILGFVAGVLYSIIISAIMNMV